LEEKETKKQVLLEMVDYVNSTKTVFCPEILKELIDMVSANIFRTLGGT
jgi:serine/threonine-protein phosphatase 2A regulatory subunit B'